MTNPLKFLLGGLLGFALAVPAGIMQADLGLNRILHNTQWIIGPHVHVAILVGLTMTLYSAIYYLYDTCRTFRNTITPCISCILYQHSYECWVERCNWNLYAIKT